MILHVRGGSFEEEFRCLKYDTNQVIRQLEESGLSEYAPIWSAVTRQLLIGGAGHRRLPLAGRAGRIHGAGL